MHKGAAFPEKRNFEALVLGVGQEFEDWGGRGTATPAFGPLPALKIDENEKWEMGNGEYSFLLICARSCLFPIPTNPFFAGKIS